MKRILILVLVACSWFLHAKAPLDTLRKIPTYDKLSGFHIGFVQPLYRLHNEEGRWITTVDDYVMGFPIGIGLRTAWNMIVDIELVPLVKPYFRDNRQQEVHLLVHPGILIPMGSSSWTFGLRAAFELEQGQVGFTPLINRSFPIAWGLRGFVELVLPGRFGPEKSKGYTQFIGLHGGFGF